MYVLIEICRKMLYNRDVIIYQNISYMIGDIMDEYTLYLDESFIEIKNKKCDFTVCGLIVKNTYHDTVLSDLIKNLKYSIWDKEDKNVVDKYALHELDATIARKGNIKRLKREYNKIFHNKNKYGLLYSSMDKIISNSDIHILGCCVQEYELSLLYKHPINDRLSIAMNILIENYHHFLSENNAIGTICYEEMPTNQNYIIQKKYEHIMNYGSMFYSAKSINKRIKGLKFVNKYDCIAGLQIADFIPNSVARDIRHMNYSKEHRLRNVDVNIIKSKSYHGNCNKMERFGIKIIS